jgi:hypothetical protein
MLLCNTGFPWAGPRSSATETEQWWAFPILQKIKLVNRIFSISHFSVFYIDATYLTWYHVVPPVAVMLSFLTGSFVSNWYFITVQQPSQQEGQQQSVSQLTDWCIWCNVTECCQLYIYIYMYTHILHPRNNWLTDTVTSTAIFFSFTCTFIW